MFGISFIFGERMRKPKDKMALVVSMVFGGVALLFMIVGYNIDVLKETWYINSIGFMLICSAIYFLASKFE